MKIGIEKKNFTQIDLSPWKARCGAALDRLWETGWVRLSICGEDRKNLDVLTEEAERICGCSDVVVVLACGSLNRMISAVTEAAPCDTARPQVIVFGDNLSARDYARLLDRLDRRDFSLIVAAEEESLPLRCAYACLKQLLVGRYGSEQASRRILALGGARSEFLAEEAAENDFPMLICSDIASTFGAGTEFALLPLALMGINLPPRRQVPDRSSCR